MASMGKFMFKTKTYNWFQGFYMMDLNNNIHIFFVVVLSFF